jgi:hypothetical protein
MHVNAEAASSLWRNVLAGVVRFSELPPFGATPARKGR